MREAEDVNRLPFFVNPSLSKQPLRIVFLSTQMKASILIIGCFIFKPPSVPKEYAEVGVEPKQGAKCLLCFVILCLS